MNKSIVILLALFLSSFNLTGQGFFKYMSEHPDKTFYEIKKDLDAFYNSHDSGKGSGYKQYARWVYEQEKYLGPEGEFVNRYDMTQKAIKKLEKQSEARGIENKSVSGNWILEGPTDYNNYFALNGGLGRVNRVVLHPTQPNTIFACAAVGGLWKSTNSGSNWTPMTDHIPYCGTSGLAIDPANSNTMYLLTGDGDGHHVHSIGVLKTTDGGINWSKTDLEWGTSPKLYGYKIIMHPTNSNILFVAASNGLYKTTDGGNHWGSVQSGHFTDIEFMPTNPSIVYAVTTSQVFKSTNTGVSFSVLTDTDFPSQFDRIEMAVTPADSSFLYLLFGGNASTATDATFSGLFLSVDFGGDFTEMSNSPNILGDAVTGGGIHDQADYDLALAAHPFDEDIIFVGGINNWRSENRGQDWGCLSHWADIPFWPYVHGDTHHMLFDGTKLYIANDGGIYTFETSSGTWGEITQGLSIYQAYDIDVHDGHVLAGSQDNGSARWDVNNSMTADTEWGGDGFDCMWDPSSTATYYVSWQSGLLITHSTGTGFGGIEVPGFGANEYWYLDLMMHPQNFDTIYVGVGWRGPNKEVYRSYNNGNNWFDMNAGLHKDVRTMAQDPSDPNRIFVAQRDTIRRCDNAHSASPTWTNVTLPTGMPKVIEDIQFDPEENGRMYMCVSGYSAGNKVYTTNNWGASWTNITGSLKNVPTFCLQPIPGATNGLYVGTDIGVFYRDDNLGDWVFASNDLPFVPIYDLDIDNGRVYAGTYGRGIWSIPIVNSCVNNVTLTGANPGVGIKSYYALNTINSSQRIEGNYNTDIKYISEGTITLTTGFHAKAANLFEAKRDDCPN